jgi:hypothetical protein
VQIPASDYEFKFANSNDWSKQDWGNEQGPTGTAGPTTGGAANIRISVPQTAFYRLRFNDLTLEYALQRLSPDN